MDTLLFMERDLEVKMLLAVPQKKAKQIVPNLAFTIQKDAPKAWQKFTVFLKKTYLLPQSAHSRILIHQYFQYLENPYQIGHLISFLDSNSIDVEISGNSEAFFWRLQGGKEVGKYLTRMNAFTHGILAGFNEMERRL